MSTIVERIESKCPKLATISGERILIFGGSGSLGTTVIRRWISTNEVVNISRDEEKQWLLRTTINHNNLSQRIGDISSLEDVKDAILRHDPTVLCIFACLKHIDLCEKFPKKSMQINAQGIMNVEHVLQMYTHNVKTVLFVSTDKACLPITTYGCCKSIAELFLQTIQSTKTKWVGVRYGNVLNSSGSILPYLRGQRETNTPLTLTHEEMTRFIMTLDQSVNLIEYALMNGQHNELIIPNIDAMRITDLFSIFAKKYGKEVKITGLRCKEKIHEDLLSIAEAKQSYQRGSYFHVTPNIRNEGVNPFASCDTLLSEEELSSYLESKGFV